MKALARKKKKKSRWKLQEDEIERREDTQNLAETVSRRQAWSKGKMPQKDAGRCHWILLLEGLGLT